jgi:acyl-CoA thioesterase-2
LTAVSVAFRDLMELRPLDETSFRACGHPGLPAERVFGGQLVAQALWAAGQGVPAGLRPHSLHAYFLRPAGCDRSVDYHVTALKQGRNLSAYRVDASQGGRVVFTLSASFESGSDDQPQVACAGPRVMPEPGDCWPDPAYAGAPLATFPATDGFDVRFVRPPSDGPRAFHPCWVRSTRDLSADPLLSACALAFISDMGALSGCVPPAEAAMAYGGASLDHDLRFGQVTRLDDWHAFDFRPVLRTGRRGLGQGCLRTAGGTVAAVIAQEGFFPFTTSVTQPADY